MKIFAIEGCDPIKGGNFGDDLNLWLWPKLFSKSADTLFDDDTLFVGIGTILNDCLPSSPRKKIIFGAGYGYGGHPKIDNNWKLVCVRGPLTASTLGLQSDLALCDSAILVREVIKINSINRRTGIVFMPHYATAGVENWQRVCDEAGITYLSPGQSSENIIHTIASSELVISEAMHGAIIADAYRVPWIPVRIGSYINEFKWNDWTSSLNIEYSFSSLPHNWNFYPSSKFRFKKIKQKLGEFTTKVAIERLKSLVRYGKRYLSEDKKFDATYQRMLYYFNELEL